MFTQVLVWTITSWLNASCTVGPGSQYINLSGAYYTSHQGRIITAVSIQGDHVIHVFPEGITPAQLGPCGTAVTEVVGLYEDGIIIDYSGLMSTLSNLPGQNVYPGLNGWHYTAENGYVTQLFGREFVFLFDGTDRYYRRHGSGHRRYVLTNPPTVADFLIAHPQARDITALFYGQGG